MKRALILTACSVLAAACASSHADRFYILAPQPSAAPAARTSPVTQATLRVKLPAWIDRSQMVVDTSRDGVTVLEHERWAAPLSDLVAQTLAMDLERRRSNLVVSELGASHAANYISVVVSVLKVSVRQGERTAMEVQWRVTDSGAGTEVIRSGEFSSGIANGDYALVAQSFSDCLAQLAEKITDDLPPAQ